MALKCYRPPDPGGFRPSGSMECTVQRPEPTANKARVAAKKYSEPHGSRLQPMQCTDWEDGVLGTKKKTVLPSVRRCRVHVVAKLYSGPHGRNCGQFL
jgi:hypothetical protein